MKKKKFNYNILIQIVTSIVVFCIILIIFFLVLSQIGTIYGNLPPPNSTQEWKMILNSDKCEWWNFGCQKLACVIDCEKINNRSKENGEGIICVC